MTTDDPALAGYTEWKQWGEARFGHCSKGDARYFAWHVARCHPAAIKSALEIGFGNGNFLGWARARGIDVVGIETQAALRERANNADLESHASLAELDGKRQFDLIVAFDVFEHIEQSNLFALCQDLATRMKPNGALLCRVPNGESPLGRMLQHGDLTHLSTLGLSKFRQIAATTGMEVACFGEWPWYRSARNPKRLARAALQRLIERTLAFACHWETNALSPNLVVALRHSSALKAPAEQLHR